MTTNNTVTLRTIFDNTGLYETPDSRIAPIMKVGANIKFDILDINLGDNYEFCKVKVSAENEAMIFTTQPDEAKEYYIRSYFLGALEGEDESLELLSLVKEQAEEKYTTDEIKIKDAKIGIPYKENGKYNIVIDTGLTQPHELPTKLTGMKLESLDTLLEYFGKNVDNISHAAKQSFVENPFNLMQHSEPYLPTRPNQNIRIKLSISEKYFQVFEEMDFQTFSVANIHKNFIACNIKVNEIEGIIDSLAKILDKYDSQISKFSGEIEGLDFKKMSNDARKFLSDFKKYLLENDVVISSSDNNKLELGFDKESLSLSYVLYYDPFGKFLKIGMNMFCKLMDIKISKLLINYRNILSSLQSGMGWMDFCKNYFTGEYTINFAKLAQIGSVAKKSLTNLQDDIQAAKADFEDMSLMIPKDVSGLEALKNDEKFRETAAELLMRSKDVVGDNFLINLPEILANIQDLNSLYTLVFDKVSIKDLTDIMLENIGEKMNLPDLNEIKVRGILKAINSEEIPNIITDAITGGIVAIEDLVESFTEGYNFSEQQYLKFIEAVQTVVSEVGGFDFLDCILHIKEDGKLGGYLPESYEDEQVLTQLEVKLSELNIASKDETSHWNISKSYIDFKDLFSQSFANNIIKEIFTNGIKQFTIKNTFGNSETTGNLPKQKFNIAALDFFKNIDKKQLTKALDNLIKNMFSDSKKHQEAVKLASVDYDGTSNATQSPYYDSNQFTMPSDLMKKLLNISKIKNELDKLNLTKKKLLKKAAGLNLDHEIKKLDANFKLPSIQDVNPSFDFSKFQFENTGDMFGSAVEAIEKSIISGIESGLVASFKSMLQRVLESLNKDSPDIDKPDYGGLNMNDILDATSGFGAEMMAKLASIKIEGSLERSKKKGKQYCKDLDIENIDLPSLDTIRGMFDDISLSLKPMELTRIMKGQVNSRDYDNISSAIQNPDLKTIITEDLFLEIIGIATDYVDMNLLESLEHAYTQEEVMISVCEDAGIPYNKRDIRTDLGNKYPNLTDNEVDELVDSIVDDVKDSMIDAIGNLKENFQDNLPFGEDPCSFMPKPSDIPPMDYVDDMAFNSIFDPIEIEYKGEAAVVPDLLMSANQSDSYVQLYYYAFDNMIDPGSVGTDENGMPTIGFIPANETEAWETVGGGKRIYNEEFGNHYVGRSTKLYELRANEFHELTEEELEKRAQEERPIDVQQNEKGEWEIDFPEQVYVRKLDQELTPLPELKNWLLRPVFGVAQKLDHAGRKKIRLSLKIDDHTSIQDSDYELEFTEGGYAYKKLIPDPALVDVECGEQIEVTGVTGDSTTQQSIVRDIEDAVRTSFEESSFYIDPQSATTKIEKIIEFQNHYANYSHQYARMNFNEEVGTENNEGYRPFAARIVGAIFEQLGRMISKTKLFNTSDMLAFVIDDEDINLLKLQDEKNSAKDEYKAECSFTEDDNMLEASSIKRLIYLTIRIFVIEEVVRGCFMYDKYYNLQADDEYCDTIFSSVLAEISQYSEGYYESIFRPEYNKAFGESLPKIADIGDTATPPRFKEAVKEIYEDISRNFDQLFRKAEKSVYAAFLKNCEWDMDTPSKGTRKDMGYLIANSFGRYMQPDRDLYAASTERKEKIRSRFVIQRSVQKHDDYVNRMQMEIPYATAGINKTENPDYDIVVKFCYVYQYHVETGATPDLPSTPNPGFGLIDNYSALFQNVALPEPVGDFGMTWDRIAYNKQDTSYEVVLNYGRSDEKRFMILPLAIMREGVPSQQLPLEFSEKYRDKDLLAEYILAKTSDGNDSKILDFLKTKARIPVMKEFLASSIQTRMLTIKPEIALMFRETKTAIRKAIESLAQDAYDYEERDTRATQLEQSSEVSTNPEFSSKAAKMALMTVPMIIKGFAETFDNNIQLASAIRKTFDKAGVDIPPAAASLLALPSNVIPMAPGPPITPLGLLYLATNFLEPKERKKLANLKRGKNLNPHADPETGSFAGGSLEEQIAAATETAIENAKEAKERYERIVTGIIEMRRVLTVVRHRLAISMPSGKLYVPHGWNFVRLHRSPLGESPMYNYAMAWGDCRFDDLPYTVSNWVCVDGSINEEEDIEGESILPLCKYDKQSSDGYPTIPLILRPDWTNNWGNYSPPIPLPVIVSSDLTGEMKDVPIANILAQVWNQSYEDIAPGPLDITGNGFGLLPAFHEWQTMGGNVKADDTFQPSEGADWSVTKIFWSTNSHHEGVGLRRAIGQVFKHTYIMFAIRVYMVYFLDKCLSDNGQGQISSDYFSDIMNPDTGYNTRIFGDSLTMSINGSHKDPQNATIAQIPGIITKVIDVAESEWNSQYNFNKSSITSGTT